MIENLKLEIGNYLKLKMRINSAFLLTASAAIIWGATAPIMKLTLAQIPLFSLAFIRMILAASILAIFIRHQLKINKKDWLIFCQCAIFGVSLNLALFFFGLKLTQAINASFLVASVPIFTILAAHFLLKEKITTRLIFAATIALFGIIIIIGKPYTPLEKTATIGNILLLLAGLSWVIHEIVAKKLLKIYDGGVVAFYSMAIGAATFAPFALWEFWKDPTWVSGVNTQGFAGLLYGILFASLLAYWAWQKGLAQIPAGQASFFFYLDPISGVILAIILLGEKITPQLLAGGAAVAIGVILAEHHRKIHPLHR